MATWEPEEHDAASDSSSWSHADCGEERPGGSSPSKLPATSHSSLLGSDVTTVASGVGRVSASGIVAQRTYLVC